MRNIMLVDDEVNVLHALQRALKRNFFDEPVHIEIHTDPWQGLERAGERTFDLVVSDYRMPLMTGVEFLKSFREVQPDTARLMLSASTEFDAVMSAVNEAVVFRYITKPWTESDLWETVQQALSQRDHLLENQRLADEKRAEQGMITPQELEARRLEALEPGITKVNRGPDGGVILGEL
jgi:DNA-binding NtrC family response regulator